jgi:hypothetical protein
VTDRNGWTAADGQQGISAAVAEKEGKRQTPQAWANQRLKLTGAAILVFRASTSLQAAPAA